MIKAYSQETKGYFEDFAQLHLIIEREKKILPLQQKAIICPIAYLAISPAGCNQSTTL